MLKNAYLLAKIGADTTENERTKKNNLPKIIEKLATTLPYRRGSLPDTARSTALASSRSGLQKTNPAVANFAPISSIFANLCKFLAGSFSAVSKQNFQVNMRLTAFFKLYKMCTLLHRSKLSI